MPSSTRLFPFLAAACLGASACGGGDLVLPGEAGPPAELLLVSGDDQSAAAGAELPDPLRVRLVDELGAGVQGTVTWVVGMGDGSVTPASVVTGADGVAEARWTLGPTPGANTVSAVAAGLAVVTFTASATGGGGGGDGGGDGGDGGGGGDGGDDGGSGGGDPFPHHLVFQVEPADAVEDERLSPPVIVAVVDQNGEIMPVDKIKIWLELAAGPGELEGKRDKETKGGLAVFDDVKVDTPGEGYVLRALAPEDAPLGSVESRTFRVEEKDD